MGQDKEALQDAQRTSWRNLWYHTGQDKEALQDAQRTSWYNQTFKEQSKDFIEYSKRSYIIISQKLDEMGQQITVETSHEGFG